MLKKQRFIGLADESSRREREKEKEGDRVKCELVRLVVVKMQMKYIRFYHWLVSMENALEPDSYNA